MSTAYVGEIRMFGFPRVPNGWFACDGSLQPIAQYQTLYTLIGTTYGGDGVQTFGLPDLRGRIPVHQGQGLGLSAYRLGQTGGSEAITLTTSQIPQHTHIMVASTATATTATPGPTVMLGTSAGANTDNLYVGFTNIAAPAPQVLTPSAISTAGSNLPHENCMPTTIASYCICWAGVFPTQN